MRSAMRCQLLVVHVCFVLFSLFQIATVLADVRYVSAVRGDDANDCTFSTPCRQFRRAIESVPLGSTEVIALDSGEYHGLTVKDKELSLTASPGTYVIVDTIDIDNAIKNYSAWIRGVRTGGITYKGDGVLLVEDSVIHGYSQTGSIGILTRGGSLVLKDTTIEHTSEGIFIQDPSGPISMHRAYLANNFYGLRMETSEYESKGEAQISIVDSVVTHNRYGVHITAQGDWITFLLHNSSIVANKNGINVQGITWARVSSSVIAHNNFGIVGPVRSAGNNTVIFNLHHNDFIGTFPLK